MIRHIIFENFNIWNEEGKMLCRNCHKKVQKPFTYYCSKECQTEFIYTHDWNALRWAILKEHPICEKCNNFQSWEVHHKLQVKDRPDLLFERSNLIALCELCHNAKHYRKKPIFRNNSRAKRDCYIRAVVEETSSFMHKAKYVTNEMVEESLKDRIMTIKEEKVTLPPSHRYKLSFYCLIYELNNKFKKNSYITEWNPKKQKWHKIYGIWKQKLIKQILITPKTLPKMNDVINIILNGTCLICPDRLKLKNKDVENFENYKQLECYFNY